MSANGSLGDVNGPALLWWGLVAAPLINNLYHYIAVVAEIANRQAKEDEMPDLDRRIAATSR